MAERWTIQHQGIGKHEVTGFRSPENARAKVLKHFLSRREGWDQIVKAPGPRELNQRLKAMGDGAESHAILDEASERYVSGVRRRTGPGQILQAELGWHLPETDMAAKRTSVVSAAGIFAAFRWSRDVSDLATAFRPVPRVQRGALTVRQYVDAAKRKLARFVEVSERLQQHRELDPPQKWNGGR